MRRLSLLVVAGLAAAALTAATAGALPRPKATVVVSSSKYGRILFDGRGFALYAFTHDPRGKSTCAGACAGAWPPYLLRGRLHAGKGTKASLLGMIRRPDGSKQVTYAGRPLYYYVGDRQAGQILCQNVSEFGGLWLVVGPTGAPVR
jgi:predicted lipoprotein with Yx(FWY)xxD motif